MQEEGSPLQSCPMKVTVEVDDDKLPTKDDKPSSSGTLGHHTKEAYLEIQVNERYHNCWMREAT